MHSKQDYEAVAGIIRREVEAHDLPGDVHAGALMALGDTARALSAYFGGGNPRFSRTRFLAACKVGE